MNDYPAADTPSAGGLPPNAQQADEDPFDPNALGVDRPSIVDRFAFASLNWIYWALSALIDDADAHTVVFGCRNETGACQPLSADEWGHYGVVKPSVASSVVVPWQRAMFSLTAGIALLSALLIGLEYMYSGVNLTIRVSLSERLQWLFLGLLLSFLSPWLVEVALGLNLAWTRAVGNLAGTMSFDAAMGQLFTGQNSIGAVGSAFAYAVAR
ncbi:MAG TPA: hypothetical protein VIK73_10350, partial [Limnochordales bacterium]